MAMVARRRNMIKNSVGIERWNTKPDLDCFLAPSRFYQSIPVFGQRQDLSDPDLNRCRGRNKGWPPAGFAFDRIHRIEADVEPHALGHQALDELTVGIAREQQINSGTECHDLDRGLVRAVQLQQIIGDADHEALFFGIVVRKLQYNAVLGERLVRQRCRFRVRNPGKGCQHQRRHRGPAEATNHRSSMAATVKSFETRHPGPAIPGLSSTPRKATPPPRGSLIFPERRYLARTSHTGAPSCWLTEAHPATL